MKYQIKQGNQGKQKKKGKREKTMKNRKYSVKLDLAKINWERVERIFFADRKSMQVKAELEQKRKVRVKEMLKILAGGAIFGLSLVIPVAPMVLSPILIERKRYDQSTFNQSISRMEKQKLIEIVENNGQSVVKITEKGRVRALRYKLSEIQIKRPKVWDKKWRLVIFDIPEKYKRMREIFRQHLKIMGFYMLQRSVWVHPYPCENEIEFLRQIYRVGVNVTYILAERIENVEDLREHFKLA